MTPPVVLFACVHNGGRSLAAKVLTAHYGQGRVDVRSAGSEPGDSLNPAVVQVLEERGLSTAGERMIDWPLDDPKGQPLEVVRRIVDQVDDRVRDLLAELVPDLQLPPRS
ncbi:MAG: heat-shock protein HtpX [Frankiales bacterium]|nr:MAG: heat-shock protein HtpX [Frankiales bacterium]